MEVAIHAGALLGQGPRWDAVSEQLLWVDIDGRALHLFDPAEDEDRVIRFDARIGSAAPMDDGRVLVALADRLAVVELESESVRTLVEIPHDEGIPAQRRRLRSGRAVLGREHGARLRAGSRGALPLFARRRP